MTTTKAFASKLAVAFVAAAMVVAAYAPAAQAQTTEDLQKMINDLLAQVAQLQAQTGQGATQTASGVCPYTWTRDLSTGSTGADVMKLQQFLNADPDTRVAAAGAGSVGAETSYYGPATAAAVSKMQVKYRAEVLSPGGLVNPTGYFGPSSRAKANAMCVAAPVTPPTDGGSTDGGDMTDDKDDMKLSGEASLDTLEIDSASDDELEEGAKDAEIAEVTVEFADGDAEISRMDVQLIGSGDEQDPWDTFENISLWVDGDKIAEKSIDDEDDYLDEDDGSVRFSGLKLVAKEDKEVDITIAVTVQSSVDGTNDGEAWTVEVNSLRFFDADGVATTETSGMDFGSTESFTIEEEGNEDEVIVKTSSNDPESTTLQVEDDKKSDWYNVFTFDLDTDDSVNDIEFDGIELTVELSSSTYGAIVDDAELVIDGKTIDDVTVGNSANATTTLTFDVDGDVTVDAGKRVEAKLMLRFNSLVAGNEGMTVEAKLTSTQADAIDAEGADDLDASQLSGSASGEAHTLRTTGINVSKKSVDADVETPDGATNDYGTYVVEVEVTAFEQDVYISTNPATSTSFTLEDGAGVAAVAGTRSVTLTSTADEGGAGDAFFEITEGETETLTLTVTYTPGVANTAARLVLNSISFDETGTVTATDDKTQTTLPAKDYRTAVITMVD